VITCYDDALRAILLFTYKMSDAGVVGRQLATEQDFGAADKLVSSDETPVEEHVEYGEFIDPKYAAQLMSESMPDEDLPSVSLPRKSAASESVAEEVSTTRNQ
jgi:hypothetical protein